MTNKIKLIRRRAGLIGLSIMFIAGHLCLLSIPVLALNGKFDSTFFEKNDIKLYDPEFVSCSAKEETDTAKLDATNQKKIWDYLIKQALSPEQAAGILGNIEIESGGSYSPTANESTITFPNGGYGIAGWSGDRRTNIVDYLTELMPGIVLKYYTVDYSSAGSYTSPNEGYVPKNVKTGELMSVEDNDKLLTAELDFLVTELKSRALQKPAIDKSYGTAEEKEWDVLKKQTGVKTASDIWVYSFKTPESNVDSIADARARVSQSLYETFGGKASSQASQEAASCGGGDKRQLAQQIIDSGNAIYWSATPEQEKNIIADIASGTNDGNTWPCGMNINMLRSIAAIVKEHTITITSTNRACSADNPEGSGEKSRHAAGNGSALDFDYIDGLFAETVDGANLILQYMAPFLPDNSGVGQITDTRAGHIGNSCLPTSSLTSLPSGIQINRFPDFCHHLHVDVPPNSDPDLQCKSNVHYGGCDTNQV